jgi:L-lactate dehydrogenase complex protein LldF
MAEPFRARIRAALADEGLQAALDGNAERRRQARLQAYASLPEALPVMRQRARLIRANTIAALPELLEQFTAKAQANGLIVHRAVDAAQAVEMVVELARRHGVRLAVKSKTMLGEEIGLNAGLEQAGIRVVETDLGEYIVQLRHERPAHIITPAVHLSRSDVARTFSEELGVPYDESIPTMTAIARKVLREAFLTADLGICGVNFGVVESGSLCLLTNEGNGRMVASLPRLQIALMGVERLTPTLEDLACLLELLPRSATGQKLTVYTNLIQAARQAGELEGPLERHLILVDNGRSALLGSPLEEALFCIRCGACLNACPVFQEIGGHAYVGRLGQATAYPGPIGAVLSPALFGGGVFANLARASSLCGACKEACPVEIDLPRLLLRVRAGFALPTAGGVKPAKPQPAAAPLGLRLGLRLFSWAACSPVRFQLAQGMAAWLGRLAAPRSGWLRLPAATGWGASRDFPRPALKPFHQRYQELASQPSTPAGEPAEAADGEVGLAPPDKHGAGSRLERFCEELELLGGKVELSPRQELADHVLSLLQARGVERLLAWEAECLPDGLIMALQAGGIKIVHSPDAQAQAGLTGALAGLANSGTLALTGGKGRPLSASLLPEIHLAILDSACLYASLESFLAEKTARQALCDAPAAVLISGPSRTADIEMTLTIGVHGPREVIVFCLV